MINQMAVAIPPRKELKIMADWKNININKNQIKADTGKAVLIALPHNSKYDGFSFWHPSKLVRNGRHSAAVSIGYTNDFTFTLKKYGNGKYNGRDVIAEKVISVEEFENAYGVENENITEKNIKNPYETHKPQEVEAIENNAIKELQDNE